MWRISETLIISAVSWILIPNFKFFPSILKAPLLHTVATILQISLQVTFTFLQVLAPEVIQNPPANGGRLLAIKNIFQGF
jgi:hypothetical protein